MSMRKAAVARRIVRAIQRRVPNARSGAVVLAYHLVGAGTSSAVDLSKATLISHLDWLRNHAHVVSFADVDPNGPPNQVVITFDDAYQNFHDVAWPLLKERGLPATLYVPIDYIDGGDCPIRDTALPPCTWDQLRSMVNEGLSIGSHTRSHPDLRTVHGEALRTEIAHSRRDLEERLGCDVPTFCYPRGLTTETSVAAVTAAYRWGVVGGGRRFRGRTPPAMVPRISLRREHDVNALAAMVMQRVWIEEFIADKVRQRLA